MTPLFRAELKERLFVHYVGGRWLAPLSMETVPAVEVPEVGTCAAVCARTDDVRRARAALRPTRDWPLSAGLSAVTAARALEGFDDPAEGPAPLPALPGRDGPLVLLSAACAPVSMLIGILRAGAARGVLWKPAPAAAASAHALVETLQPALGASVALLQGDHHSGALTAACGDLIWASPAAVPVGLHAGLTLASTAPRRR